MLIPHYSRGKGAWKPVNTASPAGMAELHCVSEVLSVPAPAPPGLTGQSPVCAWYLVPVGKPGVKPGRAASCLPGTCAVEPVLAKGRVQEYWRENKRSVRHLRQGWWEVQMFELASRPNVSQKVQNLVKLLSGSSDPSIGQAGECRISQTCTIENDGKAVHTNAFFYKLCFYRTAFQFLLSKLD